MATRAGKDAHAEDNRKGDPHHDRSGSGNSDNDLHDYYTCRRAASLKSPEWRRKVERILTMLNTAADPSELDLPGFAYHELKHDRKGTYSVTIHGNWRITFKWDDRGPFDVDMEDYHGR